MSYSDYGDEPRRSNRRAPREPAGPAKVQGSMAAAILVFVAIVGFGIGALIASSGGDDDPDNTTTEEQDGAPPGTPDNDESTEPDDTEGEDSSNSADEDADENDDQEVVGAEGITAISQQDGGEVVADESGRIGVQATLDSG